MTPTRRRVILSMLFALWACVIVVFNPVGTPLREGSLLAFWPFVWSGAVFAMPCLFAVWAALARQPLAVRLPRAIACAILLGLMATWGALLNNSGRNPDVDFLLMILSMVCILAMALAMLRRRYGWQVRMEAETEEDSGLPDRAQYSISQMLAWTTATAALLALATCIVSDWQAVIDSLRNANWPTATLGVLMISVLALPLLIPSVGLVLGIDRRWRFAVWLLAMILVVFLVACTLSLGIGLFAGASFEEAFSVTMGVILIPTGFLVALLGSLLVVRLCGFRLVRHYNEPIDAPA